MRKTKYFFTKTWIFVEVFVEIIHNSDWSGSCTCKGGSSGSHPFAFSYGIEARYRLSGRIHLIAGISGMTTAKNFGNQRFTAEDFSLALKLSSLILGCTRQSTKLAWVLCRVQPKIPI